MAATSATRNTTGLSPAQKAAATRAKDAVNLLKADHAEVKQCFKDYQKLVDGDAGPAERQSLARKICMLLTVHAQIEEEIFYPEARNLLEADDLPMVDEADVEHASAKELISQIQGMSAEQDHYDAKVKVLGEYIDHHVKEEQDELFPAVKKAGMDTKGIGELLMERKQALMAELAGRPVH